MLPWAALVACKAVLTVQQAASCRSIEFDVQIADDGAWVLSHEPVSGTSAQLRGTDLPFDEFVAGLKGRRFDFVNLDVKERSLGPGDGRLTRALERHAAALAALAAQTGTFVATTPVPARYAELERFAERRPTGMKIGLEVADYTSDDARRWKLPLTRLEALVMPLGRLANDLYRRWRGSEIRYIEVQERTAAAMAPPPGGATVLCWTRDPAEGPPPALCRWTVRASAPARAG